MKIVVTDTDFGDSDFERSMVEEAGIEFAAYNSADCREPAAIIDHLHDADGAITSYGRYSADVFRSLPNLKVVAKTGTGYDNIDVDAATENNTAVCNVVGYGTEVVSDHAIALAMCVLRRINAIDSDMRNGVWNFHSRRPLGQISGRIFGIVGYGNIGRATAKKASGMGFEVRVWDRKFPPGSVTDEGFGCTEYNDLVRCADILSFHTALTPETYHLLDAQAISSMKRDAVVVNTSRGAVVDTDALAGALQAGMLWGAGIDVFEYEPIDPVSPIMDAPNTVLTSHCAYWSEESAVELRRRCTQNAIDAVLGKEPENCVNPSVLRR